MQESVLTIQFCIGEQWRISIFLGLSACVLVIIGHHSRALGRALSVLWAYVLVQALYLFEYPSLPFGINNTAFEATAGQSFAEMLLVPLAVLTLPEKTADRALKLFQLVIVWEIFCVWARQRGLMHAWSFDTAFIALYYPFAPPWLRVASLLTIFSHHGSTALMILGVQVLVFAYTRRRFRIALVTILPVLGLIAYLHSHSSLLDGSERLALYKRHLARWATSSMAVLFGVGPGTYRNTSLLIDNFKLPMFFHMHSDWLQWLFELGVTGFTLIAVSFARIVHRVRRDTTLLAATLSVGAFALTYHPFRFFPSMLLIALIFKRSLTK